MGVAEFKLILWILVILRGVYGVMGPTHIMLHMCYMCRPITCTKCVQHDWSTLVLHIMY